MLYELGLSYLIIEISLLTKAQRGQRYVSVYIESGLHLIEQ